MLFWKSAFDLLNTANLGCLHSSDCMWIFTDSTCTHNFDNGWDGGKMMGASSVAQLFAQEADGNYQVNTVDDLNNSDLGFQAGADTNYSLTFNNVGLENEYSNIYLVDLNENKTTEITQSGTQYAFNANNTAPEKRFRIIAKPAVSTVITKEQKVSSKESLTLFSSYDKVFVHNKSGAIGLLSLYSLNGNLLKQVTIDAYGITTVSTHLPSGVYVAKAATSLEAINQSIIIR